MTRSSRRSSSDRRWLKVLSTLNEFQARLYVADKAMDWGRGGISYLSKLTGMSRTTITQTVHELEQGRKMVRPPEGRVRQPGGGRKRAEEEPGIRQQLNAIVEESTAGDPMSLLRWTSKSTRRIAQELTRRGHAISWMTVARYLQQMGYSLQANRKTREGPQHPNRDAQFRYLHSLVKRFLRRGDPVISVDTKKKELVGAFKNAGRTWRPRGQPIEVHVQDFPHLGQGKALPYGAYDIARDRAVVHVGITHDTAEFAVESMRHWWKLDGHRAYQGARQLLICADAGGSHGSRPRAWKVQLQRLANPIGMSITVCHYPPGTSKWNQIEHRLFSFISLNWKGRPLLNYETVVNLIGATRTRSGLQVKALLDTNQYEIGNEVSTAEFKQVNLRKHRVHPDWNYTISPVAGS